MSEILRVAHIDKRLDQWDVLRDVGFALRRGETLAVIGPSGCGKSTLLQVIAGHLRPDAGEISLFGDAVTGYTRRIALMPQRDMLLPWATLLDNAALPLRLAGQSSRQARKTAQGYMESFGLAGFENTYPGQLSGGMRQRAAMLRTVLSRAEVLLLDEPFGALDAITRKQMQQFLLAKNRELGSTVVLVTHDVEEAVFLATRVIVLSGRPAQVLLSMELPAERGREWMLGQECARIKRELFAALGEE